MRVPPPPVRIVEVGPRDGLQNIQPLIPHQVKVALIRNLLDTGLNCVELTSMVSARRVPQMADAKEVLSDGIIQDLLKKQQKQPEQDRDYGRQDGSPELRLPVLVPNMRGLDAALAHGVREVAVFVSATEGFSRANTGCSVQEGIERAREVSRKALAAGLTVRGYVSCIFEDPYEGPTDPARVLHCVRELLDMGCYEVSLGDTTGVGTPDQVASLIEYLTTTRDHSDTGKAPTPVPVQRLAGHFHDTYGRAKANVLQAYLGGVRVFDSSVAGLGGCPFAPGARGNVATEEIVALFHRLGVETGVNPKRIRAVGKWISGIVNSLESGHDKGIRT